MIPAIGFRLGKKVNENLGVENKEFENEGVLTAKTQHPLILKLRKIFQELSPLSRLGRYTAIVDHTIGHGEVLCPDGHVVDCHLVKSPLAQFYGRRLALDQHPWLPLAVINKNVGALLQGVVGEAAFDAKQ